jgi:hypothetical protein
MSMTLVVSICFMLNGSHSPLVCHDEVVAVKETDESPSDACMPAQMMIAQWKGHSKFAGPQWIVGGYRCDPHYVPKDAI